MKPIELPDDITSFLAYIEFHLGRYIEAHVQDRMLEITIALKK